MTATNPALQALVEALKDPSLPADQRAALIATLQAVAGAVVQAVAGPVVHAAPRGARPPQHRGERVTLTKSAVAAMALPDRGERLVYDTVAPQLAVRLRPSGRSYTLILWDRERRKKITRTLGKCSAMTPEQARVQAQKQVGRVADGQDIRRERDDAMTLGALIEQWHEEKSRTARTADELRDKALHYLGSQARRPAREIEREDIGRIHHHIATKARKRIFKTVGEAVQAVETGKEGMPATADKWRAAVSAVYAWGVAKGLVSVNPCEGIGNAFDAKGAARTTYLKGAELLRFWKALDVDEDADTRDVIRVLLYTGQRRGNVLTMKWSDIDLAAGIWTLNATQTKQKRAQSTPLVSQAAEILQRRATDAAGPWVFPATRAAKGKDLGAMSETRLRDAWARICTAANLVDVRPHDLRHTSGSWLARLGASEAVRQKALGHQTPAMAARYSHLELDPVADALQRVADAVQAEATRPAAAVRQFKAR